MSKKTTTATERANREAKTGKTPATVKPKAAKQTVPTTDTAPSPVVPHKIASAVVADAVPADATTKPTHEIKKAHADFNREMKSKMLATLSFDDWVTEGSPSAEAWLGRFKKKKQAERAPAVKRDGSANFYCGSLESGRVQEVLNQINQHTSQTPLVASAVFGKSQYPNRIARMLASKGLVASAKTEQGTVFYATAQAT